MFFLEKNLFVFDVQYNVDIIHMAEKKTRWIEQQGRITSNIAVYAIAHFVLSDLQYE